MVKLSTVVIGPQNIAPGGVASFKFSRPQNCKAVFLVSFAGSDDSLMTLGAMEDTAIVIKNTHATATVSNVRVTVGFWTSQTIS